MLVFGVLAAVLPVSAQTTLVAWSNPAGGSWSLAGNWSGGVIASSSSRTADFSALNLSSTPTVNLDGARTIGGLAFGDTTPSHGWILATGTGGPLTLATANSQAPEIRVKDVSAGTTINTVLAGTLGMRKTGPGLLKLGGLNSYTGSTVVAEGTLELAANSGGSGTLASQTLVVQEGAGVTASVSNALGYGGTNWVRTLTINRNASFVSTALNADMGWGLAIGIQGGTLEARGTGARICAGGTSTVNVLASDRTATIRGQFRLREGNPNDRVPFTVAAGSAGSTHYPDLLVTDGITQLNGAYGIEKAGTGVMQLAGACSFTGPTLVSAGTLVVTGSLSTASTTTVNGGGTATLAGTGTLWGPVVINGALEPGVRGIGTLTINHTLTLGTSSKTRMEISKSTAGATGDFVSGVTTLTMGGTLTVVLKDGGEPLAHGDSFTLFSATTRSGAFASVVLPTLPTGHSWDTSALATQGRIMVRAPYHAADLRISPTTDQLDLGFGQTRTVTRTLSNANAQLAAPWVVFAPPSLVNTLPLVDLSGGLLPRETLFTQAIQDRHRFAGGQSGLGVADESITPYAIRPRITYQRSATDTTMAETNLDNTGGSVVGAGENGSGAPSYFTRKSDGFWSMSADLVRCKQLNFSRFRSSPGVFSVYTLAHGSSRWKVFLCKDRPATHALHQIIITPDDPSIVQPEVDTEFTVTGLPAACRVHALLFAKPGTVHYDDVTCLKVAKGWLAAAAAPAKWLGLPSMTGSAPAGQDTPFVLQPDATGLAAGSHLARWTVAHKDFDIWTLPEASFGTTTMKVGQAGFTIDRSLVELSPCRGAAPSPQRIRLTGNPGVSVADPVLTSSQPWVVPSVSENRPQDVDLTFDTKALPVGTHEAKVTITLGSTRQTVVVKLTVEATRVTRLVSHPWRNRVYGIHQSGTAAGSLLVIDPADASILRVLPLGAWTTDLAIDADGTTLYALGTGEGRIRRFDLDRLVEIDSRVIPGWTLSTDPAILPQLLVGPTGLLYFLSAETQAALWVFDYPTGTVLQTARPDSPFGLSSFCHDRANNRLIVTTCNNWTSQLAASTLAAPIEADGRLGKMYGDVDEAAIQLPDGPSESRLLAAPDGGRLYFRTSPVDRVSMARTSPAFASRVLALSDNGKVLATESGVLRAEDAGSLLALNATLPVVAFSADQRRLLGFDSTTSTLKAVDLAPLAGILGNTIVPADGSDAYNGTLAWEPVKDASQYHVYLSADAASLQQDGVARPAEELRVASVNDNHLVVPDALSPGSRWFWRVDPVTLDGTAAGTVRSFTVPAAFPAARGLDLDVVRGLAEVRRPVAIARAPGAPAWTASSDQPWLTTAGSGATLEVIARPSSLAAGWHRGTVRIQCNGTTASIPVTLRVRVPNITMVRSDPALPRVYAVHEDSVDDPAHGGQVLVIDPVTSTIIGQGSAGRTVTSLAVHVADDRLYLTNWRTGGLVALDRGTLVQQKRWSFPGIVHSSLTREDAYYVDAGGPGRVMVEAADQTVAVRWFDTRTGTVVSQSRLSAANGRFGPDGLTYFRKESNSTRSIYKYSLAGGSLQFLKFVEPTTWIDSTSPALRAIVVSTDGSRVFMSGTSFTNDLVEVNHYGEAVLDCSSDGAFAATPTRLVATASATTLFTLPFTSDLVAVSSPSRKLVAFRAAPAADEAMFQVTDLETTLAPGAVEPSSPVANGAVINGTLASLSWTADPLARSYRLFFGEDASAIAAAVAGSALQIASGPLTTAALPAALVPGRTYYWRVDRIGYYATDTGDVRSFTVAPVVLSQAATSIDQPIQVPVPRTTLALTAPAATSWQASTPTPWIKLLSTSGSTPATLAFDIDVTGLALGAYSGVVRVTAGGRTLEHPVTLKRVAARYTRIVADRTLSRLYAINQVAISATDPAHLVVIDAATGNALSSVPVGNSVTDLAVHAAENRIYVTNWHGGKLLALNRTTLAIDRKYTFGLPYSGTDAYLVAAGSTGRVMVEAVDQWIGIQLLDTVSGSVLGRAPLGSGPGGGEFDPTGRIYWHGDNDVWQASFDKFDTISGSIAGKASLWPAMWLSEYGSRIITVSGDGSRIFWNGNMFDTTPGSLWHLGSHVFASNTNGSRALGTNALFDTVAKTTLMTLPRTATDGAWSPASDRWFYLSDGLLYSFTAPAPAGAAVLNVAGAAVPAQAAFLPVTDCRIADGAFVLRFHRAADDTAAWWLETSTDLLGWEPLPAAPMNLLSDDANGETIQAVVPLDGARRFFRVRRQ